MSPSHGTGSIFSVLARTCTRLRQSVSPAIGFTVGAALVAVLLAACGVLPPRMGAPMSIAAEPSPDSPLVRIAEVSMPSPELSGFRLMPHAAYSLDARIELTHRAKYSLDIQYYLIQNDLTGRLLLRNVRDAAKRGVRVRLLVDDLYTFGADPMFIGLSAFPNVEVRLFNPFCCGQSGVQVHGVADGLPPPEPPDAQQAFHR
jgi:cardiolipin synthase C